MTASNPLHARHYRWSGNVPVGNNTFGNNTFGNAKRSVAFRQAKTDNKTPFHFRAIHSTIRQTARLYGCAV